MALTLSGSTGVPKTGLPSGTVLQVVYAEKTDTFSTTVNTTSGGAAVTGVTASITPQSTSSRILVLCDGVCGFTSTVAQAYLWLARGTTKIGAGTPNSSAVGVGTRAYYQDAGVALPFALSCLDSPNTTSSVTYNLYLGSQASGTVYINRTQNDNGTAADGHRGATRLTLMEIA